MRNYLPAAWLILIPVSAVATLAAWLIPFLSTPGNGGALKMYAILPGIAISSVSYGAFAALYALLNRVMTRKLVFTLGTIHLVSSFLGLVSGSSVRFWIHQSLVGGDRPELRATITWSILPAVFSAAATLAFFATMIVALQETRKRMNPQTFD